MTAICAVVQDGKVWMGADSAGVAGYALTSRGDMKVFAKDPFLMGFTSSFRMGQLLHWSFKVPPRVEGVSDEEYMSTTFVDAVRQCLKDGGFATVKDGAEVGGTFLVGYRGRIWEVEEDFQVGISLAEFGAVGSGAQVCLGSLDATSSQVMSAEDRIRKALTAAERFGAAVRQPFHVLREP